MRMENSFKNRTQLNYHKENITCLLNELPGFDPVISVLLDSMHLLFLGVMKFLLKTWIVDRSNIACLKLSQVKLLRGCYL